MEGEGWRDAMTASLVKLELLARAMGSASTAPRAQAAT